MRPSSSRAVSPSSLAHEPLDAMQAGGEALRQNVMPDAASVIGSVADLEASVDRCHQHLIVPGALRLTERRARRGHRSLLLRRRKERNKSGMKLASIIGGQSEIGDELLEPGMRPNWPEGGIQGHADQLLFVLGQTDIQPFHGFPAIAAHAVNSRDIPG